uniref:26S proteasome regulatory subunit 8-like n=1 Tax=Dermatophagoides pteronyssinus TaxID=6956 RepID=A0A6P6Y4J4_DERPT|nr:26S proteasome regulatory subunit 8-like [Dermatophagoides pteronyssinus]
MHSPIQQYFLHQIKKRNKELAALKHETLRLRAERDTINSRVKELKEEVDGLLEVACPVGEVVKALSKTRVLVKLNSDGRYIVELGPNVKIEDCTPNRRVALASDNYAIQRTLPMHTNPLISLMKVEKVPDSTYADIGGLEEQIKEVKEVIELSIKNPQIFERLGISQPKGAGMYALRERRVYITQDDFEMAVAKVMQHDAYKNVTLKKLFK